jgi:cytochrome c556
VAAVVVLAGLGVVAIGGVRSAGASQVASPQATVEARQAALKKMGAAMKVIVDQLKSAAPDTARMLEAAQLLAARAEELPRWFPAGSGSDSGIETDALPYIWQNRAKFDALASELTPASKALTSALQRNDLPAVRSQAKAVSDTCAACHRSFRAD